MKKVERGGEGNGYSSPERKLTVSKPFVHSFIKNK